MSSRGLDASMVKRSTWLTGGGSVVLLVSTFLTWWKASDGTPSGVQKVAEQLKLASARQGYATIGWDTGLLGKLIFVVALVSVVLVVLEHDEFDTSELPVPISLALLAAGSSSLLLAVLRFYDTPDGIGRALGLYVAIIAAAVLAYGGWLKLQGEWLQVQEE